VSDRVTNRLPKMNITKINEKINSKNASQERKEEERKNYKHKPQEENLFENLNHEVWPK